MHAPPHKPIWIAASCTAVLLGGGCQSAWLAGPESTGQGRVDSLIASREAASESHDYQMTGMRTVDQTVDRTVVPPGPAVAPSDEAMSAVMEDVRQIGLTDPAAQQALLAKLHRSKPDLWPLVVQQFRSSLAYHKQLTAQETNAATSGSTAPANQAWPSTELRPSSQIGALVDPRGVRPDAAVEQAFATATPANMPAPFDPRVGPPASTAPYTPRVFANDVAADPISTNDGGQKVAASPDRVESLPGGPAGVELATYTSATDPYEAIDRTRPKPVRDEPAVDWQLQLDQAIDDLSRRVGDSPQSTAEVHQLVSLRLMDLLAGNTEQALRPIPKISPAEQDYWSNQIFALATYLDHHTQPDDKRRAAASVIHLDDAVAHLRELGSLSLRNLAFCKNVYDYGAYDPYDEPRFSPGQKVTLYVEVENYHSESTEEGYCTSLGTSYKLLDEEGKRVSGGEFPDVEDCCRSRRRDFHIQYGLVLPKRLAAGEYRLELAMKDRLSDKRGNTSIAFSIGE